MRFSLASCLLTVLAACEPAEKTPAPTHGDDALPPEPSSASLDEPIYASPALAGNRIFVRTSTRLYSFGTQE